MEDLKNQFRSLFSPPDPRKKSALPPKAHFSIWYFLVAFLIITLIQRPVGTSNLRAPQATHVPPPRFFSQ
jgi:hypothetical protein